MKDCQVCLTTDHADDVPTCPFCGEASWTECTRPPESSRRTATSEAPVASKGKR